MAREVCSQLAGRLRGVREETYGEYGLPLLAESLGIPARTWARYEAGATVPDVVIMRFIELTGVCAYWLLTGNGQRRNRSDPSRGVQA